MAAVQTEGKPPEEAFNPAVKRSGWQPPRDSGLWEVTDALQQRLWGVLPPQVSEHLRVPPHPSAPPCARASEEHAPRPHRHS